MFPNWNDPNYYYPNPYQAGGNSESDGTSSSSHWQGHTLPSHAPYQADSPQHSPTEYYSPESLKSPPQAYTTPTGSPPHAYSTYQDNATAPGRASSQQSSSSTLSKFRRLFIRDGGGSRTAQTGSSSGHPGQPSISKGKIKRYVHSAYKDLRYYHGTNKTNVDNMRANGMRLSMKRPGATDVALAGGARRPPGVVENARRHNYFTTVKWAATTYAAAASVSNMRTWEPKAGDEGVQKVARLFRTDDFPQFEKDPDSPITVSFLNSLYRTRGDIPSHAFRQEKGDSRYSEEILTAMQRHIEGKFKVSLSLQQINDSLINDVESDSDEDF